MSKGPLTERAYKLVATDNGLETNQLRTAIRRYKKEYEYQKKRRLREKEYRETDPRYGLYCKRCDHIKRQAKKEGLGYQAVQELLDLAYKEIYG
jgi:hypothetical protein